MRNKGGVILLTVIVTLLCIYYLSFSLVTKGINKDATQFATDSVGNVNFNKKQNYLDSIWKKPVYHLLGIEYTYKEIKETALSLGLDLQGGMHVTLEVSPVEIIKGLSGNNQDLNFLEALKQASQLQRNSQESFTTLFYRSFKEIAPDANLGPIFSNAANRDRISFNSTDEEVLDIIEAEVEDAIDRSFTILRTRIDRFGTSQPNIQRLKGTGRIQIELPGVENKERVRKLLQGVAKLEFWEVYQPQEIYQTFQSINNILVEEQNLAAQLELLKVSGADSDSVQETAVEDLASLLSIDKLSTDSLDTTVSSNDLVSQLEGVQPVASSLDSLTNSNISPIFSQYGFLIYNLDDTSKINRILNRKDIKTLLPSTLKLYWAHKAEVLDDGTELLEMFAIKASRGGKAPLEGDVITNARQDLDQSARPAVYMKMNATGAKKWKKLTGANIQRRIAILLDNYVYSAPNVQDEIPDGSSVISGNFTIEEAKDLANVLKAGALPAPTRIVEEAVIGPTLGREAQAQGIISIISGFALVVIFMMAYYSKGGIVANLALLFNIFFILGILAQWNAALTLPGIAGIVLTIGISIDANVLIFERIREELRNGVNLKGSIAAGYKKAYSSIVDANVTTFLTGLILYALGQGPVKGFAITLMIGIACSFFSAVFITRVVVEWMSKKGEQSSLSFATPFSKGLMNKLNLDFMGKRKIAYVFSSVFIVLGISSIILQGGLNLGVDFKGGRSYIVTFNDPVVASQLKTGIMPYFENAGTEVKTYGANNVLKVTTTYLVDDESAEADQKVEVSMIKGLEELTGLTFVPSNSKMGKDNFTISGSSKVGATIADDIKNASIQSVILALIVIFLYILVRFRKWQFGLGAVIALLHDTLFVLSAFAFSSFLGIKNFEIDQVFIAAMLTVIGYSINDTVIVFDRIRENLRLNIKKEMMDTFNLSINHTMNRTLITSLTTLLVVVVLLIFGGEVLRGFSFALLVGILIGTYSSIFIATPLAADLSKKVISKS